MGGVRRVRPHHCAPEVFLRARPLEISSAPGLGFVGRSLASMFTAAPRGNNSVANLEVFSPQHGCVGVPLLMGGFLRCTVNNRIAFVTLRPSVIHGWKKK